MLFKIKNKSQAKRILDAIMLFKIITNATIITDNDFENLSVLKAYQAARKTQKATKEDILNVLK